MGFLGKIFGKKSVNNSYHNDDGNKVKGLSIGLSLDEKNGVSFTPSDVGVSTGSEAGDFYVYEWFIEDTGEIFYVGKGRENRHKDFHERAYAAEKIREKYDTNTHFVGTDLSEQQAIELESKEMSRILNETNDRLTNRIVPLLSKRDNGYDRSPNTPELFFEKTPVLYPSEIDEHYFEVESQAFDEVKSESLKKVVFITRNMGTEIDIIYGGDLSNYREETEELLSKNESRILSTQFAKSVTSWIYIGDEYVTNYITDQEKALERIGRNIPTYHLLDVRSFLKDKYGEVKTDSKDKVLINPIHNRVPLSEINNLTDWKRGFDEGMPLWEQGDRQRKDGNFKKSIELFDKARFNGYEAPALYNSYAMAFRKLKDFDNEIAILDEAIERLNSENQNGSEVSVMKFKERREKSLLLKQKQDNIN